jgi:signal transduction histidine kinase
MNKLQFNEDNITSKLLELQKLEGKAKENSLTSTGHELKSDLCHIFTNLDAARQRYDPSNMTISQSKFYERYGSELNPIQRAYIGNVQARTQLMINSIGQLTDICSKKELDNSDVRDLERNSSRIIDYFNEIIEFSPLTDNLLKFGELNKKRQEYSKIADFCINDTIYLYNRKFSPKFQTEIYSIQNDIKNYWTEQFQNISNNNNIKLNKPGIADVRSKKDYFGNVFMPLFKNIYNHAFNTKNDIDNRLESIIDNKQIGAYSDVNEDKRVITYKIKDNGFGIRPEVIDKIFDKGFTTKTDTTTEHGIGLWAVKNFVEENGGKVLVESELGKYTKFSFTIPYDRKESDSYIKD